MPILNKHIEELIEKATEESRSFSYRFGNTCTISFDKEKFAKLLIKECLDIIQKEVSMRYKDGGETEEFMAGHYAASLLSRRKIKDYFGLDCETN